MTGSRGRRVHELQDQDAFEPAVVAGGDGAISIQETEMHMGVEHRRSRRRCITAGVILLVIAFISLLAPDYTSSAGVLFYAPGDVLHCYQLFWMQHVVPLFDASMTGKKLYDVTSAIADTGLMYQQVFGRLGKTLLCLVCGFLLAVSGMLFQSSFRNPLAAPATLGATDGVNLGFTIFVMMGYLTISQAPVLFYAVVYGTGAVTLGAVLLLSRYINGSKRFNVFDMLLIGTVLAQLIAAFVTFMNSYFMSYDSFLAFYDLQNAVNNEFEPATYIGIAIVAPLTLIPTFLLRFRLNLIAFPDEEGRLLGINPGRLRFLALVLGSVMVLGSLMAVGQVAMLSIAVPYLARYAFGAEFRKQLLGNFFLGAIILLLCELIASCININAVPMPVGTMVTFVVMPFFVWMMALRRRTWE